MLIVETEEDADTKKKKVVNLHKVYHKSHTAYAGAENTQENRKQ